MNNSCFPGSAMISVLFAMILFSFLFFRLNFFQILVKPFKALFPELPVIPDPVRCLFEWCSFKCARSPLRILPTTDQLSFLENLQMLRDGRETHVEWLCYLLHACLAPGQTL